MYIPPAAVVLISLLVFGVAPTQQQVVKINWFWPDSGSSAGGTL
jgi:hypothetical protein